MKKYAIIVAGGKGTRMKTDVPKQFLLIEDEPIIVKTIRAFRSCTSPIDIVVVLPKGNLSTWNSIQATFFPNQGIKTVLGGDTRTQSVLAGLNQIEGSGLVAIHDAVRPYVTAEIIEESYVSAEAHGSGVTAVSLKDSIRERLPDGNSKTKDRANYVLVQTPQTFRVKELKEAYLQLKKENFYTDDASVYEGAGFQVRLIEGSYANIKITTPDDLR